MPLEEDIYRIRKKLKRLDIKLVKKTSKTRRSLTYITAALLLISGGYASYKIGGPIIENTQK